MAAWRPEAPCRRSEETASAVDDISLSAMRNQGARAEGAGWQELLARAVTDPQELLSLLELDPRDVPVLDPATTGDEFPLRVPRGYVSRMVKGDPRDPLLLQVLPLACELTEVAGFGVDPLAEAQGSPVPGLLHKYSGRALLVVVGSCAIHCRYCFRRHFPYDQNRLTRNLDRALAYLASDSGLHEVILSGGDPLSAPDSVLAPLVRRLATIAHLRRLRVHTRMPVVLPERVDDALLGWLTATRLQSVVVIHANHANEIDPAVVSALARLRSAGVTLLNQSVLLRGVNDSVESLARLSEALFDAGVLPYYLHLLDRVQGAAHFEVPEEEARRLLTGLLRKLPGYLVPRLVREEKGEAFKRPVGIATHPSSSDIHSVPGK